LNTAPVSEISDILETLDLYLLLPACNYNAHICILIHPTPTLTHFETAALTLSLQKDRMDSNTAPPDAMYLAARALIQQAAPHVHEGSEGEGTSDPPPPTRPRTHVHDRSTEEALTLLESLKSTLRLATSQEYGVGGWMVREEREQVQGGSGEGEEDEHFFGKRREVGEGGVGSGRHLGGVSSGRVVKSKKVGLITLADKHRLKQEAKQRLLAAELSKCTFAPAISARYSPPPSYSFLHLHCHSPPMSSALTHVMCCLF